MKNKKQQMTWEDAGKITDKLIQAISASGEREFRGMEFYKLNVNSFHDNNIAAALVFAIEAGRQRNAASETAAYGRICAMLVFGVVGECDFSQIMQIIGVGNYQ